MKRKPRILFVLLCVAVLALQLSQLAARFLPVAAQIRQDIGKSSAWRGANFAFGREAAAYLEFVNRSVPVDVPILLGNPAGPEYLARPVDAQIFLFPHHVYNCVSDQYPRCVTEDALQAALITDAETAALVQDSPAYGAHTDDLGLLFSGDAPGVQHSTWRDYSSAAEFLFGYVPPLLLALAIVAPAILLAAFGLPKLNAPLHIGTGIVVGFGVHSLLVFLGLQFTAGVISGGLVIACVVLPWILVVLLRRPLLALNWRTWLDLPRFWPIYLTVVCFLGIAAFIGTGTAYSYVDEYLLWAAKSYGIVAEGLKTGLSGWGTFTTRYPLNIFLNIAGFASLFGDRLPESKLIFPVLYAAMLLMMGGWIQQRGGRTWAWVGVLILASSPLLFFHATLGYANLALSVYSIGALVIGLSRTKGSPLWAGILLVLAAWTRPEGLTISAMLGFLLFVSYWRLDKDKKAHTFLAIALPLTLFVLAWSLVAPRLYADAGFAEGLFTGNLGSLLSGHINWNELVFTIRWLFVYLFSLQPIAWGGLALFLVLAAAAALIMRAYPDATELALLVAGVGVLAIIAGGYFMTSYASDGQDVSWWVLTGMDRMIMPGVVMLWAAAFTGSLRIFGLAEPGEPRETLSS